MTRRELIRPAEDVERQSKDLDAPNGSSGSSPTLPTYEDAVGDTPALTSEDSKSSDGKYEEQEKIHFVSSDEGTSRSSQGEQKPQKRRVIWKIFTVLAIVVLYNLLSRSLFSQSEPGMTPPASEPASDDSPWPSPREIRVHEVTNAIHGTYPLYDLLELSTSTGAIHVTIEPKPGNKTAVVKMTSKTGAIHVRFVRSAVSVGETGAENEKGIFDRSYSTQIDTLTGQIHAEVLHGGVGGETILHTKTGMLDLRVTPISDHESRIETSTMTGLNKVVVESPVHGTTLRNLTALHKTRTSGMLDVDYPREWEGRVHAWCRSTGQVDVRGAGLNLQGGGKDVYGWRGEAASKNGKIIEVVSEGTGLVKFRA